MLFKCNIKVNNAHNTHGKNKTPKIWKNNSKK